MTKLVDLIDAAGTSERKTSDLLRQVLIVASRLDALDVTSWVKKELRGYNSDDALPSYRGSFQNPVSMTWSGPMQSGRTQVVPMLGLPDELQFMAEVSLLDPLSGIEALRDAEDDPGRIWPMQVVARYMALAEQGKATYWEYMNLTGAQTIVPRTQLHSLIDTVRTTVLDFALKLESIHPEAGEPGGPTVKANEGIREVVNNFHFTVYGDGNNIATGSHSNQENEVEKLDLKGLIAAAKKLGLSLDAITDLRQAVQADNGKRGTASSRFLNKLRQGSYVLAGDVTADVVASQLEQLISAFTG